MVEYINVLKCLEIFNLESIDEKTDRNNLQNNINKVCDILDTNILYCNFKYANKSKEFFKDTRLTVSLLNNWNIKVKHELFDLARLCNAILLHNLNTSDTLNYRPCMVLVP